MHFCYNSAKSQSESIKSRWIFPDPLNIVHSIQRVCIFNGFSIKCGIMVFTHEIGWLERKRKGVVLMIECLASPLIPAPCYLFSCECWRQWPWNRIQIKSHRKWRTCSGDFIMNMMWLCHFPCHSEFALNCRYVDARKDRVTVIFSTVFKDDDDIVIGKVFMQVSAGSGRAATRHFASCYWWILKCYFFTVMPIFRKFSEILKISQKIR